MSDIHPIPDKKAGLLKQSKMLFKKGTQGLHSWIEETWKNALFGIFLFYIIFAIVIGYLIESGLPKVIDIAAILVGSLLLILFLSLLLLLASKLLRIFPSTYLILIAAIGTSLVIYSNITHIVILLYGIPLIVIGGLIGIALGYILKGEWLRFKTILHLILACSLIGLFLYWVISPGHEAAWSNEELDWSEHTVPHLPNPGVRGSYEVEKLTYGSGTDKRRAEFGSEVDLISGTVNVTPFTWHDGKIDRLYREWYWGFSLDQAPLNGRIWKPKGDGKYPLVLIVHGNHNMVDYSDEGYEYLAELLASKGYITVSVDQNYLNASFLGNLVRDNAARAWLMLEHLSLWREWNETESHPFFDSVDLEKITLIGHSRGGEAVAIATQLNQLSHYPDNANIHFDYDFDIESVVAIAPVDGQYKPTDKSVDLENVNYLVLHGSNDMDVREFLGIRQYNRVHLTEGDYFKSGLYIFGANHGQFNSSWEKDVSAPLLWLVNRKAIISPDDQRQVAQVYISSFLDATILGKHEYRLLFQNNRHFQHWLPNTLHSTQYEDSSFTPIADYSEDVDVTTATSPNVRIQGKNLAIWKERNLFLRHGSLQDNQAVYLGWNNNDAEYTFSFQEAPSKKIDLNKSASLIFNLAEANESVSSSKAYHDEDQSETELDQNESINFSIELIDRNGNRGEIILDSYIPVRPIFHIRYTKFNLLEKHLYSSFEHVLQTYEIPIADFIKENSSLDPIQLSQIVFHFDQSDEGAIVMDKIGFRQN
jgi:dienelactone hydrolase